MRFTTATQSSADPRAALYTPANQDAARLELAAIGGLTQAAFALRDTIASYCEADIAQRATVGGLEERTLREGGSVETRLDGMRVINPPHHLIAELSRTLHTLHERSFELLLRLRTEAEHLHGRLQAVPDVVTGNDALRQLSSLLESFLETAADDFRVKKPRELRAEAETHAPTSALGKLEATALQKLRAIAPYLRASVGMAEPGQPLIFDGIAQHLHREHQLRAQFLERAGTWTQEEEKRLKQEALSQKIAVVLSLAPEDELVKSLATTYVTRSSGEQTLLAFIRGYNEKINDLPLLRALLKHQPLLPLEVQHGPYILGVANAKERLAALARQQPDSLSLIACNPFEHPERYCSLEAVNKVVLELSQDQADRRAMEILLRSELGCNQTAAALVVDEVVKVAGAEENFVDRCQEVRRHLDRLEPKEIGLLLRYNPALFLEPDLETFAQRYETAFTLWATLSDRNPHKHRMSVFEMPGNYASSAVLIHTIQDLRFHHRYEEIAVTAARHGFSAATWLQRELDGGKPGGLPSQLPADVASALATAHTLATSETDRVTTLLGREEVERGFHHGRARSGIPSFEKA